MTADQGSRGASVGTIAGRWRSRLGSVMELAVAGGDTVSGSYRTSVGVTRAQHSYSLTGYVLGDALVFCVDFRPHGSVGSWAGHHLVDEDNERLVTLWHLARPAAGPHTDADVWEGILAGSDVFEREV